MMNISLKTKFALAVTLLFWSSAFVCIRYAILSYHPGSLALGRFLVGSVCMLIIYLQLPAFRPQIHIKDISSLLIIGALTLGIYHYCLNVGELTVSSGIASFIVGQAPVFTVLLAFVFLHERINLLGIVGLCISVIGMTLIMLGEESRLTMNLGCLYIFASMLCGSLYSVLQKKYLAKYHTFEVTAYIVWGGTIALLVFSPELSHDVIRASFAATLAVIYLGIFPTAIACITWGYALKRLTASRTMNFIYLMPIITTAMGWLFLGEVPALLSLVGGLLALLGVWVVNAA